MESNIAFAGVKQEPISMEEADLNYAACASRQNVPTMSTMSSESMGNFIMNQNPNATSLLSVSSSMQGMNSGEIMPKNPLLCEHCNVMFYSEKILNHHYKIHSYCKLCRISFSDSQYFYTHNLQNHINFSAMPVSCQLCSHVIIDNDILKHMQEHAFIEEKSKLDQELLKIKQERPDVAQIESTPEIDFLMSYNENKPQTSQANEPNVGNAIPTVQRPKIYVQKYVQCEICNSDVDPAKVPHVCLLELCYQCNLKFATIQELLNHIRKIHFKRNICEICKINVDEIPDLPEHVRTCLVVKIKTKDYISAHYCLKCRKEYTNREDLSIHVATTYYLNDKCYICNMELKEISDVITHLKTCMSIKSKCLEFTNTPYYCFRCKIALPDRESLLSHINSLHISEKKCEICETRVSKISDLQEHFRLCALNKLPDLLKKLRMCKKCKRKFGPGTAFAEHTIMDHQCDHCTRRFINRDELIQHLITICTLKDVMTCKFCSQVVTTDFKEHLESHATEGYRKCEKCLEVHLAKSKHFYNSMCYQPRVVQVFFK